MSKKSLFFVYFFGFLGTLILIFFINKELVNRNFQDLMNFGKAQIGQLESGEKEIEKLKKEISKLKEEIERMKGEKKAGLEIENKKIQKNLEKKEIKPKIDLSFEKEIFSGQEFEISLSIFDLEDGKYDLKISVEKEGKNLSEIFDQRKGKWQSSFYFLKEIFSGNSFLGSFKLKIKEEFEGIANLVLKIRNSETKETLAQLSKEIKILKPISKEIENQLPTASFIFSPENPALGQEILFDASSSKDLDGQILKFIWDFGDGEKKETEKPSISHSFLLSGQFTVSLLVVDNLGATSSESKVITISKPVPQKEKPTISLSFPRQISLDQEFSVKISVSNLEEKNYDIKISIEKDKKILSRIYDSEKDWKSSYYYLLNVFSGSNFEGKFKMKVLKEKIEEKGFNLPLEAVILAKIRDSNTKKIILETSDEIKIE